VRQYIPSKRSFIKRNLLNFTEFVDIWQKNIIFNKPKNGLIWFRQCFEISYGLDTWKNFLNKTFYLITRRCILKSQEEK
jgi:hypothetical protein